VKPPKKGKKGKKKGKKKGAVKTDGVPHEGDKSTSSESEASAKDSPRAPKLNKKGKKRSKASKMAAMNDLVSIPEETALLGTASAVATGSVCTFGRGFLGVANYRAVCLAWNFIGCSCR